MAGFKTHISVSATLGVGVGLYSTFVMNLDWGPACLAAGLTALGGMLPDLDSDSGVPIRELFGVAAAFIPIFLLRRLRHTQLSHDQMLVIFIGVYLTVRYGLAEFFRRLTVHRGMFHSIPALLITGLIVFLLYDHDEIGVRWFLSGGVMLGFLSHLALDELYAIDLRGLVPRLNKAAGSALKFFGPSLPANVFTYSVLFALAGVAFKPTSTASESPVRIQVTPARDRQAPPWRS